VEPGAFDTFTRSYDSAQGVSVYRVHHWTAARDWPSLARQIANRELADGEAQRFGLR
jgi:hypothetical protein